MTEQTTTTALTHTDLYGAPVPEFEITVPSELGKILYVSVDFPGMWLVREDGPSGRPLGMISQIHGGAGFGAATITRADGQSHKGFAPPQFKDAALWLYENA
jgi:hypothetical protein